MEGVRKYETTRTTYYLKNSKLTLFIVFEYIFDLLIEALRKQRRVYKLDDLIKNID